MQVTGHGLSDSIMSFINPLPQPKSFSHFQEKRDNRAKTGSAGGKKCIYDEADYIILDIIGKESPVLEGIMAPESSGTNNAAITFAYHEELANVTEEVHVNNSDSVGLVVEPLCSTVSDTFSGNHQEPSPSAGANTRKRSAQAVKKEYELLRTKKLRLQTLLLEQKLEIAKRETYKMDLELWKMEKEAGVPPSQFTAQFTNATSVMYPVNTEMMHFDASNGIIEDAIVIVNSTELDN